MLIRNQIITALLMSLVLLSTACSSGGEKFDTTYQRVTDAVLHPGDAIPVPQQEVILSVNGKIGTTNGADSIVMDRNTIEKIGLVEYQVKDPFQDRPILYRGVLMRDLLALWQLPQEAKTAVFTALNDYQVEIPVEEFSNYPILFAMQSDGVYMESDYQGPAMLVFPVDNYEFDETIVRRRWIWQIKSIELK